MRSELKPDGPIRYGETVADPVQLRDPLLELLDKTPSVGKPAAVERVLDAAEQRRAVADVRATDMQRFGERRRSAEDGELAQPLSRRIYERCSEVGQSAGPPRASLLDA
jgi:hypothetical protein